MLLYGYNAILILPPMAPASQGWLYNEDRLYYNIYQTANLREFRASVNPRFEAAIPDFMNGILNFLIHFNVVHRKVDWRNPKMKSLNSMPVYIYIATSVLVIYKAPGIE